MRILFNRGEQRMFLDNSIKTLNCLSLKGLLQFGLETNYNCLKNYYIERRLIPEELFLDMCHLIKKDPSKFRVRYISDNWGKVKGGKITKEKIRDYFFITLPFIITSFTQEPFAE
jgi:hypothetical protein